MFRKTLSIALAFVMLQSLPSAQSVFARSKTERQARFAEKVRLGVHKLGTGEEARIQVKLTGGAKLSGYIREASDDSFVIVDSSSGAETAISYTQVVQAKGHNLTLLQRILIGDAFLLGLVAICVLLLS